MPKRKSRSTHKLNRKNAPRGNHISEWLGHRIYPEVRLDISAFTRKNFGTCPFLTEALRIPTKCVKNENSFGVCSVSSTSSGPAQDWLVCPYRVISSDLVRDSCRRIFGLAGEVVQPIPVTVLKIESELNRFKAEARKNGSGYVFFQDKLGGEISVIGTAKSPEMSFDVTLVEIVPSETNTFKVAHYGILEIQTMDFHGSYQHAVQNLRDALRLHQTDFVQSLSKNSRWSGERIEGPNIANVFKRTFYQALIKFQLSGKGAAAGTVLALPKAVWDSWQPFLGAPVLERKGQDYGLKISDSPSEPGGGVNAWICIFDLNAAADLPTSPVEIKMYIRVTAEELSHHAFKVVPAGMLKSISTKDSILMRIRERLVEWWPELAGTAKN